METKIYWSSIEYKYTKPLSKSNKLIGGFVYVFINATNAKEALKKILDDLKLQGIIPIEIEFTKLYEDIKWKSSKENKHYRSLIEEAKNTENPVYDVFYAYKNNN
jgi:hypothetical protein